MALVLFLALLVLGCVDDDQGRLAGSSEDGALVLSDTLSLDRLFAGYEDVGIAPYDTSGARAWVDSVMGTLSLDEKIGQLFIAHMEASEDGHLLATASQTASMRRFDPDNPPWDGVRPTG